MQYNNEPCSDGSYWSKRNEFSAYRHEDFVLEHGDRYEPILIQGVHYFRDGEEAKYRPGVLGRCFLNAFLLCVLDAQLTYVEGFAFTYESLCSGYGPTFHAWAVDEDGKAIDTTWIEPGVEYFGVPYKGEWLMDVVIEKCGDRLLNWKCVHLLAEPELLGSLGKKPQIWKGVPGSVKQKDSNMAYYAIQGDPILRLTMRLSDTRWEGTSADFMAEVNSLEDDERNRCRGGFSWPESVRAIPSRLKEACERYPSLGIELSKRRGKGGRALWRITKR